MTAISASRAALRATSAVMVQKALSVGLRRVMRASTASVSSTGESCLERMRAAHSRADRQTISLSVTGKSQHPAHCIIRLVAARLSPTVVRDAAGRRLADTATDGQPTALLHWRPDGRLQRAQIRLPAGGWITLEPGAGEDAVYGRVDRLRWGDGAADSTVFRALDYAAVDRIPVLAEPARLPAGAGTAVLNVIAALAADQARDALAYDGPFPTEQLFLALLESFRYAPDDV